MKGQTRITLDIDIGQCDMFGASMWLICLVNSVLHVILDAQIRFVQYKHLN